MYNDDKIKPNKLNAAFPVFKPGDPGIEEAIKRGSGVGIDYTDEASDITPAQYQKALNFDYGIGPAHMKAFVTGRRCGKSWLREHNYEELEKRLMAAIPSPRADATTTDVGISPIATNSSPVNIVSVRQYLKNTVPTVTPTGRTNKTKKSKRKAQRCARRTNR